MSSTKESLKRGVSGACRKDQNCEFRLPARPRGGDSLLSLGVKNVDLRFQLTHR